MVRPHLQGQGALQISTHAIVVLISLFGFGVQAQQTPSAKNGQTQTTPSQAAAAVQTQSHPLDDVLLEETDDDDEPADLFSRVSFEYDHGSFSGGESNNRERIKGEQAFGPKGRLAVGYEIPVIKGFGYDLDGGASSPSGRGVGDIKLSMSGVLSANERFKQAAWVEVTFPSAPDSIKGAGQLVFKMAWGFYYAAGRKDRS
jgi:hypothetical protein